MPTVDFSSKAGSTPEPESRLEKFISGVAEDFWYSYRSIDGNGALQKLHSVYRPLSRSRRLGRISLPDVVSDMNYDVYNGTGKIVAESPSEETVGRELESAVNDLSEEISESETELGKVSDRTRDITQDVIDDGNIHIGHYLGRSKEMRASLVPVSYETIEGDVYDVGNSKKYAIDGEGNIRAPGLKVVDGDIDPVLYDCQVHVDVSEDIMSTEYGSGKTFHHLWRIAQFDVLSDGIEDEWELVDRMLTEDSEFSGADRKLSRLSKHASLNINENLAGFRQKSRIFKNSFSSDTNMSDLHKGMRAMSVYYGVKNSDGGSIDNVASLKRDAKFSEIFRADEMEDPDEFLLGNVQGYSELEQQFSDLDESLVEAEIDESRKDWRKSHKLLIPALISSGIYIEPKIGKTLPSEEIAYETANILSDPQVAEHASELAGTVEGASIAFLGYMAVKSAATNISSFRN